MNDIRNFKLLQTELKACKVSKNHLIRFTFHLRLFFFISVFRTQKPPKLKKVCHIRKKTESIRNRQTERQRTTQVDPYSHSKYQIGVQIWHILTSFDDSIRTRYCYCPDVKLFFLSYFLFIVHNNFSRHY